MELSSPESFINKTPKILIAKIQMIAIEIVIFAFCEHHFHDPKNSFEIDATFLFLYLWFEIFLQRLIQQA